MIMCVHPQFVTFKEFGSFDASCMKKVEDITGEKDPQEQALVCSYPYQESIHNVTHVRKLKTYFQTRYPGATIKNVFIPPNATPKLIVQKIIAAKPAGKQLTVMKLSSHGDSGLLFLAGNPPSIPLHVGNVDPFAELKPHFYAPASVIQLQGCGVASNTSIIAGGSDTDPVLVAGTWRGGVGLGYELLSRLAYLTGVPVHAALHPLSDKGTDFEPWDSYANDTVYVTPDGRAWLSWEQRWVTPPTPDWQ